MKQLRNGTFHLPRESQTFFSLYDLLYGKSLRSVGTEQKQYCSVRLYILYKMCCYRLIIDCLRVWIKRTKREFW